MFLLDWYEKYLQIKYNSRKLKNEVVVEEKVCASCETLRQQLEFSNYEKTQLLNKLLKEPEPTPVTEAPQITRPRSIPWNVRRQLLEQEDRVKAQRLRNVPKPDTTIAVVKEETADLEKELDLATRERESEATTKEA
jgi:hypothetical protein